MQQWCLCLWCQHHESALSLNTLRELTVACLALAGWAGTYDKLACAQKMCFAEGHGDQVTEEPPDRDTKAASARERYLARKRKVVD